MLLARAGGEAGIGGGLGAAKSVAGGDADRLPFPDSTLSGDRRYDSDWAPFAFRSALDLISHGPIDMKMFGELRLVRAISEEQVEIMRDPKRAPTAKLPRIEDAVKAGGFLCGNADDLIEHIKALEKKYPALDRISVSLSVGVSEEVSLEQLDRFAKEVMPAFKGGTENAPASDHC